MDAESQTVAPGREFQVEVNGELRRITGTSLDDALPQLGYRPDRPGIALAVNGRIVHRAEWSTVTLKDGDRLDVVGAVQGG